MWLLPSRGNWCYQTQSQSLGILMGCWKYISMVLSLIYFLDRICMIYLPLVNSLGPRENGCHFLDDIFKFKFQNENYCILKFHGNLFLGTIASTLQFDGTSPLYAQILTHLRSGLKMRIISQEILEISFTTTCTMYLKITHLKLKPHIPGINESNVCCRSVVVVSLMVQGPIH